MSPRVPRILAILLPLALGPAAFGLARTFAADAPAGKPEAKPTHRKPAQHLPPPGYLPAAARALLGERMEQHAEGITDLITSVVLLDHEAAADVARDIADGPRIARPLPGQSDALNASLPKRFFDLQDELHERARAVATAAAARDDRKLAQSFAALTQTCVACHSAYLNPNEAR
jgi:hypothetical protein